MSAEALDLAAVRAALTDMALEPAPGTSARAVPSPVPRRSAEHLTAVDLGPAPVSAPVTPEVTSIDLVVPGPGDELVAHLEGVLTDLDPDGDPDATPDRDDRSDDPDGDMADGAPDSEAEQLLRLFDAQAGSRWLDVAAHRLGAVGVASATPGGPGRELAAAVALTVRQTDPALLPTGWRAFHLVRSARGRRTNTLSSGVGRGLLDAARALVGSAREPMSGGRHPGGGHPGLALIPPTSSAAGHLPRAVGIAWTLGRQERLPERRRTPLTWPVDALVVAGLDAAAANHTTTAGAVNATCWTAHQGISLPLLLVCADDSSGPATGTPSGWVAAQFSGRAGLEYRYDDGNDPRSSLRVSADAARLAREKRVPVLLHLRCTRIDVQANPDTDPLAVTMRALAAAGVLTGAGLRQRWTSIRDEVAACVEEALREPHLADAGADAVTAPLAPHRPETVAARAGTAAPEGERARVFGPAFPEDEGGLTLAEAINRTLLDAGAAIPGLLLLGDGVARPGGAYGVTAGLHRRLGASRAIDTIADERMILGLALGAAVSGLLPVAEITDLGALHTAGDQLRVQATALGFSSQGSYRNPLVVRAAGLTHPRRTGTPVGLDHTLSTLRDVPGLVVACPAHPSDAPAVLRTCLAAAAEDGTVSVVLEPAGLYHERDMVVPGDGAWLAPYHPPDLWGLTHVPVGRAATWGDGDDLTLVTYGHGLRLSLRVAVRLARASIGVRVVDLRWLAPLPVDDVLREASATGRCLVVDETRRSAGVSEALVTALLEAGYTGRLARITADDCWVPPGPAGDLLLVTEDDLEGAVHALLE